MQNTVHLRIQRRNRPSCKTKMRLIRGISRAGNAEHLYNGIGNMMNAENVSTTKQVELTDTEIALIKASLNVCALMFSGQKPDEAEMRLINAMSTLGGTAARIYKKLKAV